jgi:hypothetical protein
MFSMGCSGEPASDYACYERQNDPLEYIPQNDDERAAISAAKHFLFFTREPEVLTEIRSFVAGLNGRP